MVIGPMGESGDRPSVRHDEELDELLRILANPIRREIVQQLSNEKDDVVTIEGLRGALGDGNDGRVAGDEVISALYHIHLPMLANTGIVDVDWKRKTIRYHAGHRIEALRSRIIESTEA